MATKLSDFLDPVSVISTHFRCDNCGIVLCKPSWSQCTVCKMFDLCDECEEPGYNKLPSRTRDKHRKLHIDNSGDRQITDDCMKPILIEEAEKHGKEDRVGLREKELDRMQEKKKIENDYDISIVMGKLKQIRNASSSTAFEKEQELHLNAMIAEYYMKAFERNIRVLCLDGGGVRGYMPIKVLGEAIKKKYFADNEPMDHDDPIFKERFIKAQLKFINNFDYLAGTSTGGLIAFCLAINYNILELEKIYTEFSKYFKRTWTGFLSRGVISAKFDPSPIHKEIDDIIDKLELPDGKKLSAKNATLLDIRNILNPDNIIDRKNAERIAPNHGNLLEFVDEQIPMQGSNDIDENTHLCRAKGEKVLLITAYNTTRSMMTVFNTSYAEHWQYRIADVLKATMAAPTYFPPYQLAMGSNYDDSFQPVNKSEVYIDGGVFANDPELAALWAIRMQWKKPANYHVLSIGTGCYTTELSSTTWGGYWAWLFKPGQTGFLVNTLMDATRSLTEIVTSNLAKFNNMRRMKFNYKLKESMELDDPKFVQKFNTEWKSLKTEEDFKALMYFYNNYIEKQNLSEH